MNAKKGIIYISSGREYHKMALASAQSVKRYNPSLKIHLFTDEEFIGSPFVDSWDLIINAHRRSKVDYMHQSPFDNTLFLDADTFVLTNLDELFEVLERFEIALAHAHRRNNPPNLEKWRTNIPNAFPQFNSGVILYKKNKKTTQLLKNWCTAYHENGFKKDQVTLRELLWLSDLRIHVLPPEYNVRFKKYTEIWEEKEAIPKILHYEEFTVFFKKMESFLSK